MSKLIKIIYTLNDIDSSLSFEPLNKFSVLKNLIILTQKINLDEYEIYYRNQNFSWNEEKTVKEIVGKDLVPVFNIKKKSIVKSNVLSSTSPVKDINVKTTLVIENFPSRKEICDYLDKFFEDIHSPKDYHINHLGSSIEIKFNDSDIAFKFTKLINNEKLNNAVYSKIKTRLDFETKKKPPIYNFKSIYKKSIADEIKDLSSLDLTDSDKKIINSSNSPKKSSLTSKLMTHLNDIKSEKIREKIKKLYYSQAGALRTSAPYIPENNIVYKDHLENKKKWMNKKGMLPSLRHSDNNIILNDVNYNLPFGKPISDYVYRDLIKKKTMMLENK